MNMLSAVLIMSRIILTAIASQVILQVSFRLLVNYRRSKFHHLSIDFDDQTLNKDSIL